MSQHERDELRAAAAESARLQADLAAVEALERRVAELPETDFQKLAQAVRDASSASLDRQDFARQVVKLAKLGLTIGIALA